MQTREPGSPRSWIRVERIGLRGPGVVIVLGDDPSRCRAFAEAIAELLGIAPERRIVLASLLAATVASARRDARALDALEQRLGIPARVSLLSDTLVVGRALADEIRAALPDLERMLGRAPSRFIADGLAPAPEVRVLDWLEYCLRRGRALPGTWADALVDEVLASPATRAAVGAGAVLLLSGHPRTPSDAHRLLDRLEALGAPVLKLLWLCRGEGSRARGGGVRGEDPGPVRAARDGDLRALREALDDALGRSRIALVDDDEASLAAAGSPRVSGAPLASGLRALGAPAVLVEDLLEARAERMASPSSIAPGSPSSVTASK